LQPSGNHRACAGRADHQQRDDGERDQHEQRRFRERELDASDVPEDEKIGDLELMDRVHER
jgi:hypothetical protein